MARGAKGLGVNGRHKLLCTLSGGPVSPRYVNAMLKRLAGRAGIEKRVHAHGLRHFFAATLVQGGATMHDAQTLLGHASLAVTSEYLRGIAPAESIRAAHDVFSSVWADVE